MSKPNLEEARGLALSRGGVFLSDTFINTQTKYLWQCSKGHQWEAKYSHVKWAESWCPYCSGRRNGSLQRLQDAALARGGKCLSDKYINSHTKYFWECHLGHRWEQAGSEIVLAKTWCPTCSGKRQTIEQLQAYAESRGGKCLSDAYSGSQAKYEWRCEKGHEWKANWNNALNKKAWCPVCPQKKSKAELEVYDYVKSLFPDAISGFRPLKNKRFSLDIYIPSLKKAIEIDGEYWHSAPEVVVRDKKKDAQCIDAGIALLRVKWGNWVQCKQNIEDTINHYLQSITS